MGWVRIDDNFADHPKVIALSDKAFRLFITGLCYSNRQLTDGIIPYQIVTAWVGDDPFKPSDELEDQDLWERIDKGFVIKSYAEYQPTRKEVETKREANRERLKKFRDRKQQSNTNVTPLPTQPNPNPTPINKDIQPYETNLEIEIPIPRVHTAKAAALRISDKLGEARKNGINAWNISKLVEDEWDKLHNEDDIGGCIALTAWYVSELQSRQVTSPEIARIGQMIKRFGRIALLAIDESSSKNLTGDNLVNYAFRVAQNMYADKKA